MTGRSPARLLAPLALAVAAIALVLVLTSGGGPEPAGDTAQPTATATATAKGGGTKKRRPASRTYTVKPGDSPSSIAEKTGVDLQALLAANPDADPGALTVGDELKLPPK